MAGPARRQKRQEVLSSGSRLLNVLVFCLLFVFPYIAISLPQIPHWLGRTIAASMFIFVMSAGIFWFALSPKSQMIGRGAKVMQPQYDSIRPQMERRVRLLFVLFGVLFLAVITLPFVLDLVQLCLVKEPTAIASVTKSRSVPFLGLWFIEQTVTLSDGRNYYLLYSFEPLHVRQSYEFAVIPRSRLILDFHEPPK